MLSLAQPRLNANAKKNILSCLRENTLTQGAFNVEFEKRFREFCQTKHAITCTNGTIALLLALKALGIGPGDEVIVPTLTFAATASAVIQAGARPVFVDSHEEDFNISAEDTERHMTPNIKAIIVVHLYGVPCDMNAFIRLSEKYHCPIIEDAAEALGSQYNKRPVGSIGHIGCFSFYGNKLITTGEGGMCITNNDTLYDKMMVYKNHGMRPEKRYWHEIPATNARMTNILAAIGTSQMEDVPRFIKKRLILGKIYEKEFAHIENIRLPRTPSNTFVVPWLTTVLIPKIKKERIVEDLKQAGIDSRPGFYPCHLMPAFSEYVKKDQKFPISCFLGEHLVTLPMHVGLSRKDIAYIARTLKEAVGSER